MKSLDQFIHRGDTLGRLQFTVRRLEALTRAVRRQLPSEQRTHVRGCVIRDETLIVFTDNAIHASTLRYQQSQLLAVAREYLGVSLRRVQFKVLPPEMAQHRQPTPDISQGSRQLLKQAAGTIGDDELAAALRRLAEGEDQDAG